MATFTTAYVNTLELDEDEVTGLCEELDRNNRYVLSDPDLKLWLIIDGLVLDLKPFVLKHPGGHHAILQFVGKDASQAFHSIHSGRARQQVKDFAIGVVENDEQTK